MPEPYTIDACPVYTVDGRISNGVVEHPFSFIREVDGVADVRCCSMDGDACQSQHFEGGVISRNASRTACGGTSFTSTLDDHDEIEASGVAELSENIAEFMCANSCKFCRGQKGLAWFRS